MIYLSGIETSLIRWLDCRLFETAVGQTARAESSLASAALNFQSEYLILPLISSSN
jgi:hypothetical protein